MGIERLVKVGVGASIGYIASALLVPYYSAYATTARILASTIGGVYAGSASGSKAEKPAH